MKPSSIVDRALTLATHLCAAVAVFNTVRGASFARSWLRVPALPMPLPDTPFVSIVVPARDEERSIERCVRSLLAQNLPLFEVIVVDDRSTDGTRAILARIAAEDRRLFVVDGAELPSGWVGKPWALAQGVRAARGSWYLFTDADSYHEPHGTASSVAFARALGAQALSIATFQEMETFWERAVLPTILGIIFLASGSFAELNDPKKPGAALANGQYLLVERDAYAALGGHEALRAEVVEDLEFARRLKADGRFRLVIAAGEEIASVRMYHSLREIWLGFTKNMYLGSKNGVPDLLAGFAFISVVSFVPPLLAGIALTRGRKIDALEAAMCTVTNVATASWAFERTRMPRWYGLLQPIGATVLAAITVNSAFRILSGRGVAWRGRTYGGRASE